MNRTLFFEDGSVFGGFEDNTSLVLHANGSAFTLFTKDGSRVDQMTEFATNSQHKAATKLSMLLTLRNLCSNIGPVFTSYKLSGSLFQSTVPFLYSRWPNVPLDAVEADVLAQSVLDWKKHVSLLKDGTVLVFSLDKARCVSLASHGKLVRVSFPALVKESLTGEFIYSQTHRLFPVGMCPDVWHYPVQVALAARQILTGKFEGFYFNDDRKSSSSSPSSRDTSDPDGHPSFSSSAAQHTHTAGPSDVILSLPEVVSLTDSQTQLVPNWNLPSSHSILHLHSAGLSALPKDQVLQCEWTPEAMYWIVPVQTSAHTIDYCVQILVHKDDSCLVSSPSNQTPLTFTHYLQEGQEKVYAESAIPHKIFTEGYNTDPAKFYALKSLADRGLELLAHVQSIVLTRALQEANPHKKRADSKLKTFSAKIIHENHVDQIGRFTGFQDGRVRVRFVDRAILELAHDRASCTLLLPSGHHHELPIPLQLSKLTSQQAKEIRLYLSHAMKFASECFLSVEELVSKRALDDHRDRIIAYQLDRTQQLLEGTFVPPMSEEVNSSMESTFAEDAVRAEMKQRLASSGGGSQQQGGEGGQQRKGSDANVQDVLSDLQVRNQREGEQLRLHLAKIDQLLSSVN